VSDYGELKRRVAAHGLFEPQLRYYAFTAATTLALVAAAFASLFVSPSIATDVAVAALLAIASSQLGFLLHDIAHRQLVPAGRSADALQLLTGPLLLGLSGAWWKQKHDRHHAHPNDPDKDPDIQIGLLAFTEEQAREKRRFSRVVLRYQAQLIVPLLFLEGLHLRAAGVKFLATTRTRFRRTEAVLLAVHAGCYCTAIVAAVGPLRALLVVGVHQGLFGLYAGSVFAPNHKGMPIVEPSSKLSYLERQVMTSRNVRAHPVTDWWFGGLNYQIEHHLFPTLPRNRLRDAQAVVRSFCADRGIPYCETTLWNSYRTVFTSLHDTGESARKTRRRARRTTLPD